MTAGEAGKPRAIASEPSAEWLAESLNRFARRGHPGSLDHSGKYWGREFVEPYRKRRGEAGAPRGVRDLVRLTDDEWNEWTAALRRLSFEGTFASSQDDLAWAVRVVIYWLNEWPPEGRTLDAALEKTQASEFLDAMRRHWAERH